jgi:hypothetical protein
MSQHTVFIHIAMPGRTTGDFSDYLPWVHGPYAGLVSYATAENDSNDDIYLISEIYDNDQRFGSKHTTTLIMPLVSEEFRDLHSPVYYTTNAACNAGLWLKVSDYLTHLNEGIAIFNDALHPYAVWLESFRDDIQRHLKIIEDAENNHIEGHQVHFPATPVLSIPLTRYTQFMSQRHMQKGQRFGQAFFNFMDAHKCSQDKAWWDRLYEANDMQARGMIHALLDWEN